MDATAGNVFTRFFCSGSSWRKELKTLGCRKSRVQGDVEQEELSCASYPCLSSYYNVFAVRLSIMVLLAILIGMLTVLTWHLTRVYTTKSLNSLAFGLRYELLQWPLLRMWNVLNSTSEITAAQVKLSEYVMKKYSGQPDTQAQQVELYEMMREMTWALFASRKALNAITVNYKNGFVQAFHRDHRSDNTFYIYSDMVNYSIADSYELHLHLSHERWNDQSIQGNLSAIWYREPVDPISGERIGKPTTILPDDLINVAGPSQVPDGVASWHVSVSKYTDSPLLSAALPVWDPSNKSIVAVVGVTTDLFSVGQLMKELAESHGGHIYLTSQEGYLIAASTDVPLLRNSSAGPALVKAVESGDDVIREGALWLQNASPEKFPPSDELHVENAKLGNHRFYIDSFFLNLKLLPMVGVIIIPREYIMGKVDERAFRTLIILISVSLCILIIGCVCILILTNGVSKEMRLRAELISQLEARRRAEASSNYKSQFLANMSHELRTPMAGVIGLLDILLCDDCLPNEQFGMVTQIRKCSNALLRLLNNILDLSKVESGKLVLEEAEFDMGRELEGLIDMFSVQCINHNVEIVLDLSDDMPKLVRGDSARVVQIFANLISNSIKFTTSGHIILRGWRGNPNTSYGTNRSLNKKEMVASPMKLKQHRCPKNASRREKKVTLWFEVDDTGSGIDPSKWDSVFESFEQADLSTTRMHGGTGLGLNIVKTLVNKMGGEIKVVKKDGPGTLMKLCLLLNHSDDTMELCRTEFADHKLVVLLALRGSVGRSIMSQWLHKKGFSCWQASEWNELKQTLEKILQINDVLGESEDSDLKSIEAFSEDKTLVTKNSVFVIVIDVALLDFSTNIWREQLIHLGKYSSSVKFAWVLDHNTSNSVKMELRRKNHFLMVNKPLYQAKMTLILESVIRERNHELEKASVGASVPSSSEDLCESQEDAGKMEPSSNSSESALRPEERRRKVRRRSFSQSEMVNGYLVGFDEEVQNKIWVEVATCQGQHIGVQRHERKSNLHLQKALNGEGSLEGVRILLAEDTPVLQRVATIMLEKMGAAVVVVGDGVQAVNALKCSMDADGLDERSATEDEKSNQARIWNASCIDLVLMDCQMPKMDGYEATKAIRESELGTDSHIPIVALTAHAMTSDEAKCLEVGMDAYLTKPIDCKLMASTILSLTRRNGPVLTTHNECNLFKRLTAWSSQSKVKCKENSFGLFQETNFGLPTARIVSLYQMPMLLRTELKNGVEA